MDRLTAVAPQRVLDATFWPTLASSAPGTAEQVRADLAPLLAESLGTAFVPTAGS